MSLNIAMLLRESARRKPEKTALILDHFKMNYQQLDTEARKFAGLLKHLNIEKKERVLLMLPNVPHFPICFFGTAHAGAISVPINVLYKEAEISFRLEDSQARVLVVWEGFLEEALKSFKKADSCEHLIVVRSMSSSTLPKMEGEGIHEYSDLMLQSAPGQEMVYTGADDPALILYTSGTTGMPKGAVLSHFSVFYQAVLITADVREDNVSQEGVGIAHLPFFHVFGLTNVLCSSIGLGNALTLLPQFEPGKVLEVMERDKVTYFSGVPTMYARLLSHPDFSKRDISSLNKCYSGGASLPVEIADSWKHATGVEIEEGYGMTETGSGVCTNAMPFVDTKIGSAGKPMWGTEIKVIDLEGNDLPQGEIGEIICRSPGMMNGYFNRSEANQAAFRDGWLLTGDLGFLDEQGYVHIVDRKKEMILRGGYNVYPRQIEEVLYEHPYIEECAVFGVPHTDLGEEIKAVVVPKADCILLADEVKLFCKSRLAAFKYPRMIEIRTEPLPKNGTGKILKRMLQ